MTLKQLKRKYLAEGFRLGYKKALNEAKRKSDREIEDEIMNDLKNTMEDSINTCLAAGPTNYPAIIDYWIKNHISLFQNKYDSVEIESKKKKYRDAVVIINDNVYDLETLYDVVMSRIMFG